MKLVSDMQKWVFEYEKMRGFCRRGRPLIPVWTILRFLLTPVRGVNGHPHQISLISAVSFGIICCFREMMFESYPLCSSNVVSIMS